MNHTTYNTTYNWDAGQLDENGETLLGNNIRNSNLYLEEYKGIAITIIEKDDKYNVMLNIYKNE